MKLLALATAALVTAATLPGAASAGGLVPGSDHFRNAAADRAAHSVAVGAAGGTVRETVSYGYPVGRRGGRVPGSEQISRNREAAAIDEVIRSQPGASSADRAGGIRGSRAF